MGSKTATPTYVVPLPAYLDQMLDEAHATGVLLDGAMAHPSYRAASKTGAIGSLRPNMQNAVVRNVVTAPFGTFVSVTAGYRLSFRVLAALSADTALYDALEAPDLPTWIMNRLADDGIIVSRKAAKVSMWTWEVQWTPSDDVVNRSAAENGVSVLELRAVTARMGSLFPAADAWFAAVGDEHRRDQYLRLAQATNAHRYAAARVAQQAARAVDPQSRLSVLNLDYIAAIATDRPQLVEPAVAEAVQRYFAAALDRSGKAVKVTTVAQLGLF